MTRLVPLLLAAASLLYTAAAPAQTAVRVRGTIVAVEGSTLQVRSREGEALRLQLPEKLNVTATETARFEDFKPGDFVGTTTRTRADGAMEAIEVHFLPPTAAAGQLAWDLEPETTMTNANISAVVSATGARELVLDLKGVPQKILVPPNAAVARAVPGTLADLQPGESVFAVVQKAADGALKVLRIQVGRNGVKPPQ